MAAHVRRSALMFDEHRDIDIESSTIPVLWFQTFGFNFFSSSFLSLSTHFCVVFSKATRFVAEILKIAGLYTSEYPRNLRSRVLSVVFVVISICYKRTR